MNSPQRHDAATGYSSSPNDRRCRSGTPTSPSRSPGAGLKPLIRRPVTLPEKRDRPGSVYVLAAVHKPTGKRIVKIGHTIGSVEERAQSIRSKCGDIELLDRGGPHAAGFRREIALYYRRVESLAHAELGAAGYRFICGCGTRHREYFDVDPAAARAAVLRWARFCEQAPWHYETGQKPGHTGPLRDHWERRLQTWPDLCLPSCAAPPDAWAAVWDRFVDAGFWDWLWDGVWRTRQSRFRNPYFAALAVAALAPASFVVRCFYRPSLHELVIYALAFILSLSTVAWFTPEPVVYLILKWSAPSQISVPPEETTLESTPGTPLSPASSTSTGFPPSPASVSVPASPQLPRFLPPLAFPTSPTSSPGAPPPTPPGVWEMVAIGAVVCGSIYNFVYTAVSRIWKTSWASVYAIKNGLC